MQKSRRFKYNGFNVRIKKLKYNWSITLSPIGNGHTTGFQLEGKTINTIEKKIKTRLDDVHENPIWKQRKFLREDREVEVSRKLLKQRLKKK